MERDAISFEMADVLEVDRTKFADIVRSTFDARVRGTMGGLSETISELAQRVGGTCSPKQVALAVERRLAISAELLRNSYSESHLIELKARGHRLGIVTDCSVETPLLWATTWLNDVVDVVAFSCELGVRKPDPEMYLSATRRLNPKPEDCLFVGDGDSEELHGARALGMATRMLVDQNLMDADRLNVARAWDGAVINSLTELFNDSI